MELGWIDFSKNERSKVLNVLDLLGERGVLDEMGIAQIRDAYSDLFFPGTTTIQTRAKYFFIVPYAFRDLEFNNQTDYLKLRKTLDDTEEKCARVLLDFNDDEWGIIGRRAIRSNSWVQRTPASIYWVGLRRYGFFKGNMSIDYYIRQLSFQKANNANDGNLGNSSDDGQDDKNANDKIKTHYFNVPTYKRDWFDNLNINLTAAEGEFLKNQIINSCSDSLLGHVLENDFYEVIDFESFSDLESIIKKFPEDIQNNYYNAKDFSEFVYVLRVVYNMIVSENKNEFANREFRTFDLDKISNIDINEIMNSLNIINPYLRRFLNNCRVAMKENNPELLKIHICNREVGLKGVNRSKTSHPGEFGVNEWFAGNRLDYRFSIAKAIIKDICDSEDMEGGD